MRRKIEYRQASKETYKRWCKEHPEVRITFSEYVNIIYTFNYAFRDYLFETAEKAKLPWGIGDFVVSKYKKKKKKINPKTGEEIISLPIDWKKTKESGKIIYHLNRHTEGYRFRVKWFIDSARFRWSEIWTFRPSRDSSRLLNHYIKKDPNVQYLYGEWEYRK